MVKISPRHAIMDPKPKKAVIGELVVNVTGYLEGTFNDWPAFIQDTIYAAMQRFAKKNGLKDIYILQSRCGRDDISEPYHIVVTIVGKRTRH